MTLSCLLVIIENTLVLVNALPVTIIPPLYDTNHRIDRLLNHVLIVIDADQTQILTYNPTKPTNPLSITLNNSILSQSVLL